MHPQNNYVWVAVDLNCMISAVSNLSCNIADGYLNKVDLDLF